MQDAYSIALGVSAAQSSEELDFEWFESIASTEEEANDLMLATNAKRFMNQVRIKRAGK